MSSEKRLMIQSTQYQQVMNQHADGHKDLLLQYCALNTLFYVLYTGQKGSTVLCLNYKIKRTIYKTIIYPSKITTAK